jgi:spore coat protein U-like protein
MLGANIGTTSESTSSQRYLTNGLTDPSKDRIAYELKIAGTEWGDAGLHAVDPTYIDTTAMAAVSGSSTQSFTVTGVAHFKGTTLQDAGTYQDAVTITIAY